jgi:hypothetical protein
MLSLAPAASAGEWVQRSCSYGTEYIVPEGWESKDIEGYTETPKDNCERFYDGSGLRVDIAPIDAGYMTLAGQMWSYKPPAGSTIAGGMLSVDMTAREGVALIGAKVKGSVIELAKCESPGCFEYISDVPITAVGASEIFEQAACLSKEAVCHKPKGEPFEHEGNGEFSAEAELSSAQILLSTNAVPAASGLGGTLLNSTVTGKATLSFTATDSAGPGIYQVRVKVNGEQVLAETPNLNEGKCVSTGTSEGARAFNYAQPCPTETPVHAEINTAGLPDGTHALTVELEDAAGNSSTVYAGAISVANPSSPTGTSIGPGSPLALRGPANGANASDQAKLTARWVSTAKATRTSRYGALDRITGRLTTSTGQPISGASLDLYETPASHGAVAGRIGGLVTGPTGGWTLTLPRDVSSSALRFAYRSHVDDTIPVATATLTLRVHAGIALRIAPRTTSVGHSIFFSGVLHGAPILEGGKQLVLEASSGGEWIQFDTISTNAKGRYRASYRFKFPGPITYRFRVLSRHEADFPFLEGTSNVVGVYER